MTARHQHVGFYLLNIDRDLSRGLIIIHEGYRSRIMGRIAYRRDVLDVPAREIDSAGGDQTGALGNRLLELLRADHDPVVGAHDRGFDTGPCFRVKSVGDSRKI